MTRQHVKAADAGRVAFDAYNAKRGGVNHLGKPTPPWDDLPEEIRAAWAEAAVAVVMRLVLGVLP